VTRWIEAHEVAHLLKPGMTVFIADGPSEPIHILDAFRQSGAGCAGVRFVSMSLPAINSTDFTSFHPEAKATSFFATADTREGIAAGRIDFLPLQYRAIYTYLEQYLDIDLAIMQLAPAGPNGGYSQGISVDFIPAVLDNATTVIAEINDRQPIPVDSPSVPAERIDYAVSCSLPVADFPPSKLDDTSRAIGAHVAELIRDGDCIQIGIGAIPDAAMSALSQKNDLGLHSGMLADGLMPLIDSGAMNGQAKTIDKGRAVAGVALGTPELIEWAGSCEHLSFRPVTYTHDTEVVRRIDNFVSINSALEIDLFGQVNADMLRGQQISGTGGSVDVMRGAALSKGGRSILALNATAARGTLSRIVPALSSHTATTALRTDIDYVVTEHGARHIKHLPHQARAEALIEIAAPEFRDELRDSWKELPAGS